MLTQKNDRQVNTTLRKTVAGRDVSTKNAFAVGEAVTFDLTVNRDCGVITPVLRLWPDGGTYADRPFDFVSTDYQNDTYRLVLDTTALADENGGLFFYEILLTRGVDTLFSATADNCSLTWKKHGESPFSLTLYRRDFHTPDWFCGGTMYHVFLDRFKRGEGTVTPHGKMNEKWDEGAVEYAEKNGMPLSNDTFFGGNLWGVVEALDRLNDMGVTVLYLSPIFASPSNHRYDTASYETVDGLLGGDDAFHTLCREAHRRGMKVILDGVFNHTGDDSLYFNKRKNYGSGGAFNDEKSPYRDWFFIGEDGAYATWWGIDILPKLNQNNPTCRRYFTDAKKGILARWIGADDLADGWRFDVVDELPDDFVDEARDVISAIPGQGLLIGEVWENAGTKIAYGVRRRYFTGRQLDSVMNYPFRTALIGLLNGGDALGFARTMREVYATYPTTVCHALMNLISTHDTVRILTVLGDEGTGDGLSNRELSVKRLTPEQRATATAKLKTAALVQYTVYGVPSVFYGDEAGVEGYHDPFCRRPYPWGREDGELLDFYRTVGRARRRHTVLADGDFSIVKATHDTLVYRRENADEILDVTVNLKGEKTYTFHGGARDFLTDETVEKMTLSPMTAIAVYYRKAGENA